MVASPHAQAQGHNVVVPSMTTVPVVNPGAGVELGWYLGEGDYEPVLKYKHLKCYSDKPLMEQEKFKTNRSIRLKALTLSLERESVASQAKPSI